MTNEGIKFIIKIALREDVGEGDITTKALVDKGAKARGEIVAKEAGVVAGLLVAKEVFAQVDRRIKFAPKVKDGAKVKKGKVIATVSGPARGILTGERVALNFLQRMSGIATLTREFVKRAQGAKPQILDTRKTTPGLRALEKYAVKMGGGANHRMGLYDAILIKDNHIEMSGGVGESIQRANYKLQI
ncbi:MAG: carboxylating nicotinate-nucleotide diphosphorylase, partial [Candidatus Saganbacteria bacterium]|nr:carboxylating nicotinate-nucleotide diphosphorylase [Candidatus Saganbacteria bacterium]